MESFRLYRKLDARACRGAIGRKVLLTIMTRQFFPARSFRYLTLSLLKATERCFDFGVSCELAMYWLDYCSFDKLVVV
jgi:hypothetical protein